MTACRFCGLLAAKPRVTDEMVVVAAKAYNNDFLHSNNWTFHSAIRAALESAYTVGVKPPNEGTSGVSPKPKRSHADNVAAVRNLHCENGSELFVTSLEALGLLPR